MTSFLSPNVHARTSPRTSGIVRPGRGLRGPGPVTHDMHSVARHRGTCRPERRRRRMALPARRRRCGPSPRRSVSTAAVPVLYIGGCQRSGSTLLDRMMSQVSGHVSAGEIVHLWSRGLSRTSSAGAASASPIARSGRRWAVWRSGDGGPMDVEQILRLQRRVDRNRYIIFMLLPALSPRYRRDLEPVRGHPGPPLSSDQRGRRGSGRGFFQARVHGVPPSARAVGAATRRPPRSGQPRRRVLAPEEDPTAGVGR